ncbi:MAG: hypothetical protein ACRCZZ_05070, partial [Phocaeicola sp.]
GKQSGDAGSTIFSVAKAVENYALEGWYDEANPQEKLVNSENYILAENTLKVKLTEATNGKTYKAKFANSYTVNLNVEGEGGSVPATASAAQGNFITCTATVNSDFDGVVWSDQDKNVIMESDSLQDIYVKGTSLYIKASESVNGKSYTARFGKGAPRITVKDGVLAITRNPEERGVYFQYGSVVAWYATEGAPTIAWDMSTTSTPWDNSWRIEIFFPEQTLDNIKAGKGDPARLIGLTKAEIEEGKVDNNTWRLPVLADFDEILRGGHSNVTVMNGVRGRVFGKGATPTGVGGIFIPFSGALKKDDGTNLGVGFYSISWSSEITADSAGTLLIESNSQNVSYHTQSFGLTVICIQQ